MTFTNTELKNLAGLTQLDPELLEGIKESNPNLTNTRRGNLTQEMIENQIAQEEWERENPEEVATFEETSPEEKLHIPDCDHEFFTLVQNCASAIIGTSKDSLQIGVYLTTVWEDMGDVPLKDVTTLSDFITSVFSHVGHLVS